MLSLSVRRKALLSKGVGATFTAIVPKDVGTMVVLELELEPGNWAISKFTLYWGHTVLTGVLLQV